MNQETYTLTEAADYLKLGLEATRQLFDEGKLPGVSFNQKHHVIHRADPEGYLRETTRIQTATRRQGIKPTEHVAAPKRGRKRELPALEPIERAA